MSGYLRRLVTRSDPSAQAIRPIVHSASPIAEEDQRVGLPGFDGLVTAGPAGSFETDPEDTFPPPGDLRSPAPPPVSGIIRGEGPILRRKPAGPIIAQSRPAVFQPGPAEGKPAGNAPPTGNRFAREPGRQPPRPRPGTLSGSGAPWPDSDFRETAPPPAGPAAAPAPAVVPSARLDSREEPGPRPRNRAEIEAIKRRPQRSPELDATPLQPVPRRAGAAEPGELISPDPVTSRVESEGSSRVVIGRLNVEVVPPTAEVQPAPAPARGPLTAESVSVIGSLGGVRTNLRFRLRHR